MAEIKSQKKWFIGLLGILGVSLISAGVFAATTITLNSGNAVNLGAGAAAVSVCDSSATISTQQTFSSSNQRYELTTISLENIDYSACAGKTLSMAFVDNSTTYSTTWAVTNNVSTYVWGGAAGTGATSYSALTAINTAASGISTFAVSAY